MSVSDVDISSSHGQTGTSSTECWTRAMIALQKQEKSWLSFDHHITMIDYFKLDLGAADAYITLDPPALCRLWVKKQLMDMKYVVDRIDDKRELV